MDTTLLVICAVCTPLASLAVSLRFLARMRTKACLAWDDLFAALSLLFFGAYVGCVLWSGFYFQELISRPITQIPPSDFSNAAKAGWLAGFWSPWPISAAKISILFLYWRIFSADRSIRSAIKITGVICIIWWLVATIAVACECVPIQKSWEPLIEGYCFNFSAFLVGIEIPNTLIDFWMIALAIWELKKLHLSGKDKIALMGIFSLGGLVAIISIIRMAVVYETVNDTKIVDAYWMTLQLFFSVICCCLPTYRPLVPKTNLLKNWYSSMNSLLRSRSMESQDDYGNPLSKKGYPFQGHSIVRTDAYAQAPVVREKGQNYSASKLVAGRDYPVNSIEQTTTMEVV